MTEENDTNTIVDENGNPVTIAIDGTEYYISNLSEVAQNQIVNLRICDQEIKYLQRKIAIAQTARNAYATTLKDNLPT